MPVASILWPTLNRSMLQLLAAVCVLALTACARRESAVEAGNRAAVLHVGNAQEQNYVSIGDTIQFVDTYNPDEVKGTQVVDIDGTILVPEVGAVWVAGYTRSELESYLTQKLAPEVLADWQAWAAERAQTFQRASSAVEGRNGYLSQMHHNHRGLPKRRYKVWTVLHNFDCRAPDGTTPASRFFRRSFPDLFETVFSQVGDLPRPRNRKQAMALSD